MRPPRLDPKGAARSTWHIQLEADLLACRTLNWSHKITYAYLRFRQGDNGASWPGLVTIAADLGVTKNTVIKALRDLEEVGLIRARKNRRGGRRQSNRYTIVPFPAWHRNGAEPAPFAEGQNSSESAPETVQFLHQKGSESAPEKNKKNNKEKNNDHFDPGTAVGDEGDSAKSPPRRTPRRQPPASAEDFERFWAVYPRKVAKKKCRAIWARLKPTADLVEQIIAAVAAYRRTDQWQQEGGRFIPHPSTFLRQSRWEDEIPETPDPERGDPDWLPDEAEAEQILQEAGVLL